MRPRLSVVIACRQAADTLGVQLEALTRQQADVDWEVLLCDNGSTDATLAIAATYTSRLPLRVITADQYPGAAHARNIGAATSNADWLAFVDADDEVASGWLAAIVAALRRHAFVAGRFDARRLNSQSSVRSRTLPQDTGLQRWNMGPRLPHAGAGNMGIHRSVFAAVGGFDRSLRCLEDTDFCWRVQLAGVPLVFVPNAVLHVRMRSSLRRMWRQGMAYGAAYAELEHRYASVPPPTTAVDGSAVESSDTKRWSQRLDALRSVGSLIWTLGWHIGHRRWQPDTDTTWQPPALPRDTPAQPVMPSSTTRV
jgi:glycosyltransferase involved in cell wall biosynthesis